MNRSQTLAVFGLMWLKYIEALNQPLLLPTPAACDFVAKDLTPAMLLLLESGNAPYGETHQGPGQVLEA